MSAEQRRRDNARSMARMYFKRGKIPWQACQLCGDPESQRHHPDYDRPLLIVWLCKRCHRRVHANPKLARRVEKIAAKNGQPKKIRGAYRK